jgi:5-methylcytosine-specific restriction endonuclease McrA
MVGRTGVLSASWKGGLTPIHTKIRTSFEYVKWRKSVFSRDDYTCQACGIRGVKLQADHVLPFAFYPDLRFETLNGQTLCVACHKKTPTHCAQTDIFNEPNYCR